MIGEARGLRAILGRGCKQALEQLGSSALDLAMQVKGLGIPAYDHRSYEDWIRKGERAFNLKRWMNVQRGVTRKNQLSFGVEDLGVADGEMKGKHTV